MKKSNQTSNLADFEDYACFGWCDGRRVPGKNPDFDEIHLPGGAIGIVAKRGPTMITQQREQVGHKPKKSGLVEFLDDFRNYCIVENATNPRIRLINLLRDPQAGEIMKKLNRQGSICLTNELVDEKTLLILVRFKLLGHLDWAENSFKTNALFGKLFKQLFP